MRRTKFLRWIHAHITRAGKAVRDKVSKPDRSGIQEATVDRDEVILAALATQANHRFTPVQVQKLFFLIDKKIGERIGGPYFRFEPYDYGPFDSSVYDALRGLTEKGYIVTANSSNPRTYQLTLAGSQYGQIQLSKISAELAAYLQKLTAWVTALSFAQLVSAIYQEFPEMREKSVFKG